MINQTPSDLGKFPVPPSGHPIPRGWFGRLVRFINSLILHGDGQYLTVKHTLDGQTITPTPALLQALGNGGAPPAAGGGASGLISSVSGGTASISISGSTSAVELVGTGDVTISGNTNGQIEIHGSTSGSGGSFYPVWGNLVSQSINPSWDATFEHMDPEILASSGFLFIQLSHGISIDENNRSQDIYCYVYIDNKEVFAFQRNTTLEPYSSGDPLSITLAETANQSTMVPVSAGSTVTANYYDSAGVSPGLSFTLYKDVSA